MFRRRQFGDLIDRQLQVFAEDHGDRLEAIREARAAFRTSDRDEVEERYGDYADEVDWAAEELAAVEPNGQRARSTSQVGGDRSSAGAGPR